MPTATELPIDTTASALAMAEEIFGAGVTVNSATYFGAANSSGIYTGGDTISGGVTPSDSGVILSTGLATDFTNSDGTTDTNQSGSTGTNTAGVDGDADFNALAGTGTFDAAYLEIDFTPEGDTLTIDFVISSEEYPEWIGSQFLDVVGVWINGVEAEVSIGNGTASVGNINGANTPNLFTDNTADQFNTEMDGFTVTLSFTAPVTPGVSNTIKIGVADVSDAGFDTNLLIAGNSAQTAFVALDDTVTLGNNDTTTIDVLANDSTSGGTLTITHINNIPVTAGSTVTLGTGQQVTLNADGTFTLVGDGDPETVYFNYTVADGTGNSDTAIVEIQQVPCFVSGTRIDTANGPVAVELLQAGDLVMTRDNGLMAIRWVGHHRVKAQAESIPVRICAGTLGATRDILVSANHKVLVTGVWAELLFGACEVLVAAKDLVNGRTIRWDHGQDCVTYHHVLLETHQMLISDGLVSESFKPGRQCLAHLDHAAKASLYALFPQLLEDPDAYGQTAFPVVRGRHARALLPDLAA